MKKNLLLLCLVFPSLVFCQREWYVAAKNGLSIREKPSATSTVLGKIPYNSRITVSYDSIVEISTEGFIGAWAKTTYGGKTGYVVNSYLLPLPPPKATVKTMKEYLSQLSTVAGSPVMISNGEKDIPEGEGWQLKKQLFKNGAEWHEFSAYESGSHIYFIPGLNAEQAYLLVRLIPEFKEAVAADDPLPRKDSLYRKNDTEYLVKIEKEVFSNSEWIKRIRIDFVPGAVYYFEIQEIETQVMIVLGGGL